MKIYQKKYHFFFSNGGGGARRAGPGSAFGSKTTGNVPFFCKNSQAKCTSHKLKGGVCVCVFQCPILSLCLQFPKKCIYIFPGMFFT